MYVITVCVCVCMCVCVYVCVCVCFKAIMRICECLVQVIDAGTLETGRQSDWLSASIKRERRERGRRRRLEKKRWKP